MKTTELVVIGGGPGGLAATAEAVRHGVSVTIFDENASPGGQYFHQIPPTFRATGRTALDKDRKDSVRATSLFQVINHPLVSYMPDSVIWGIFEENRIAYADATGHGCVRADNIIIATGAFDRPLPFPGWTLPGVMTAGGVQNLVISQRIIPGHRILVSGNGPLNLAVAHSLHYAGSKVIEILQASRLHHILHEVPRFLSAPAILYKGLRYGFPLIRAGIPIRMGQIVVEAHGEDRLRVCRLIYLKRI